jgi:hypothetical protein
MIQKFKLLLNTVKYLKISQIFNRLKRDFKIQNINLLSAPSTSKVSKKFQAFPLSPIKMVSENSFKFLNEVQYISQKDDWNLVTKDKLWLYNLHYFDDLNSFEGELRYSWHKSLIDLWINENPPGFGIGWDAYPTSLRIVNLIKWSLKRGDLNSEWLDSLATQAQHLSKNLETHLLGNHLFSNAKALVFAGLFFKGNEAEEWYQAGLNIIQKELD